MWECTTCAACVQACPVSIEQMPKIVDTRRFLVMEDAEFPETMQQALNSLETRGHPMRGTAFTRVDWTAGLKISTMAEAKDADVLLWVGCGGALVERNQKIVRALAQLLEKAGVKFAILGREEKCTGDPARRIGNEFLFETLAQENIATLDRYNVKTIVTSCPHCFNTLGNEYPQWGGKLRGLSSQRVSWPSSSTRASSRARCPATKKSRSTIPATWAGTTASTTRRGNWCSSPPATRRSKWSRTARTDSAAAAAAA